MSRVTLKYILEYLFSIGLLVFLLLPALVVITLLALDGHGIFFLQKRSGLHEKNFWLIKFKTMKNAEGSDIMRITSFGSILRKYSIDEWPQLLNILMGNMTLIGPRPLLPEYKGHYSQWQRNRFNILPGITGWAQVNGRNSISWEQRLALDVQYVNNWTFLMNAEILWLTIKRVLKPIHVNSDESTTMPRFDKEVK